MFLCATASAEREVDGVDAVDVNYGEWTAAAFGICARVLKGMPELDPVTGLSKATVLEKCAGPYLKIGQVIQEFGRVILP